MPKGIPNRNSQLQSKDPLNEGKGQQTAAHSHTVQPEVKAPPEPKYERPKNPKWDMQDPKISKKDKPTTWVAVFRCKNPHPIDPQSNQPCAPHKTKATNKTPASDVPCYKCGWPTEMVEIFKDKPVDYGSIRVREPETGDFEGAE